MEKLSNKKIILIISGILFLILSLAMFLLIDKKDSIFYTSYIFSALAILLPTVVTYSSKYDKSSTQVNSAILIHCSKYFILEIGLVIVAYLFKLDFKVYLVLQSILLALFIILYLLLIMGKKHITKIDDKTKGDVIDSKLLVIDLDEIILAYKKCENNENSLKLLLKIQDLIKYSDPIKSEQTHELEVKVNDLIIEIEQRIKNVNFNDFDILLEECINKIEKLNKIKKVLK